MSLLKTVDICVKSDKSLETIEKKLSAFGDVLFNGRDCLAVLKQPKEPDRQNYWLGKQYCKEKQKTMFTVTGERILWQFLHEWSSNSN